MNRTFDVEAYRSVQDMNRKTISYLTEHIAAGMTLCEVRNLCEEYLKGLGADSFWYYGVGAFVFSGEDTAVSFSGREYVTPETVIRENDIITVDLSPQRDMIWGDHARTVIVEDGRAVRDETEIMNDEWKEGVCVEKELHEQMKRFVSPETTFEELYEAMNGAINEKGYVNLDFNGNLGHTIVKNRDERIYIERGNLVRLGEVSMFTFEPHIALTGGRYGYKREDIYYFEDGILNMI